MAIVKLLYWLLLLPFLLGLFPLAGMPREKRTPGVQYLSGFFVMLAVFQLFAVPLVLREADISVLVILNLIVTSLLRWERLPFSCVACGKKPGPYL